MCTHDGEMIAVQVGFPLYISMQKIVTNKRNGSTQCVKSGILGNTFPTGDTYATLNTPYPLTISIYMDIKYVMKHLARYHIELELLRQFFCST